MNKLWDFYHRHTVSVWIAIGLLLCAIFLLVVALLAAGSSHSGDDTTMRLFTYKDGRLDVDFGNAFLLVMGIGFAISLFRKD